MKKLFLILILPLFWAQAAAQLAPDAGVTQAQRARIEVLRRDALARYAGEQQDCAGKFMVNDCLRDAKSRQREVMADLRRQEISLNDAERRRKAGQQLERTQAKTSEPAAGSSAPKEASAERLQRVARDKALEQAQADASAQSRVQAQVQRKKEHDEREAQRARKAALAASNERSYREKRQEAAQHKADLQARQRQKGQPQAKPLPDPP